MSVTDFLIKLGRIDRKIVQGIVMFTIIVLLRGVR